MDSDGVDEEVLTREEAKRILRRLELEAYSSVITAFRAQGDLSREKKQSLTDLAAHLSISTERHRAEVRRAVNDDSLHSVAECMHGIGTSTEWSIEGRRLVSLTPRLVPQTVFTAKATHTANAVSRENSKLPARKPPPQGTRERSASQSSKASERFEEKLKGKDSKPAEITRSLSTSSSTSNKSQESQDKSKKKKKPNPPSNKVLKPSKLNLPTKSEYKSSSSPNLTKQNLLSPTSLHRPVSPGGGHGSMHQKPLILQRSPQKSNQVSRSLSAEGLGPSGSQYVTKAVLQSPTSTGPFSSANEAVFKQQRVLIDSRAASSAQPTKVSQVLVASSGNSAALQKMKFKAPVAKSKAKPAKIKPLSGAQRPSSIVSPSAESLNALATSAVVPMAPISPVKPAVPNSSGALHNSSFVTSSSLATGPISSSLPSGSCPVKVVQVQKPGGTATCQSSSAGTGTKPFVVVSSATSSKAGSAQRVLALGNVPISGSQQLKIASIPNVLQQSGAKIVSIAKSMPMTTGFKMIAVTTVVPGSTQVKTVYIATPIMSVTKTSTPSVQCSAANSPLTNSPVTTKLLQTLASSSATLVRSAETDVSPSSVSASLKPSLVNSRGFAPAHSTAVSSAGTTTVTTSTTINSQSSVPLLTSVNTSITATKQNGPTHPEASNTTVVLKRDSETSPRKNLTTSKSDVPAVNDVESLAKVDDSRPDIRGVDSGGKCLSVDDRKKSSAENGPRADGGLKLSENARVSSLTFEAAGESNDETILLAGEKFLADLAAKFSKNSVDARKPPTQAVDGVDNLIEPEVDNAGKSASETAENKDAANHQFATRIQVQRRAPRANAPAGSKVIVRKIGEEYSSPINLDYDCDKTDAVAGELKEPLHGGLTSCLQEKPVDKALVAEVSPSGQGKPGQVTPSHARPEGKAGFVNQNLLNNDHSQPLLSILGKKEKELSAPEFSIIDVNKADLADDVTVEVRTTKTQLVEPERIADGDSPRNVYAAFGPANGDAEAGVQKDAGKRLSPSVLACTGSPSHELSIKQVSDTRPFSAMATSPGLKSVTRKSPLSFGAQSRDGQTLLPITSKRTLFEDGENHASVAKQRISPSKLLVDNFAAPPHQGHSPSSNSHAGPNAGNNAGTNTGHTNSVSPTVGYTSPLNSPTQKLSQAFFEKGVVEKHPISSSIQHSASSGLELQEQTMKNATQVVRGDSLFTSIIPTAAVGPAHQNSFDQSSAKPGLKNVKSRTTSGVNSSSSDGSLQQNAKNTIEILHNQGNDVTRPHITNNIARGGSKKRKSESSPVITVAWIKGALSLLQKVSRFRGAHKQRGEMNAASWFTRPVNPAEAPGYYKVIKQPMDFSTVKKRLEDGVYKDFAEFYSDMTLIKTNCHTYNPVDHLVRKDCDLVFAFFEEECCKFLEKQRKSEDSPSKKIKLDVAV